MILHVDLDAFFASVEQRDDPSLRGLPLAVAGDSRRAVVATASYEARAFGVHSAMPLYKALQRCPQLRVVRPRFEIYRAASARMFEILRAQDRVVEGLSMDEAYVDLGAVDMESAIATATLLKERTFAATGLRLSVGVASVKSVAKIASDEGKPDGLKAVPLGTERAYLAPMPVGRLWGIGPKTQASLRTHGIERIGQLADLDDDVLLYDLLGRFGLEARALARGLDDRIVADDDSIRSVSAEETFEYDVANVDGLLSTIRAQAQDIAQRMRDAGLAASTIGVKIKYSNFSVSGRQTSFVQPVDEARAIAAAAIFCLRHAGVEGRAVRLVGVKASSLTRPVAKQLALFQSVRAAV